MIEEVTRAPRSKHAQQRALLHAWLRRSEHDRFKEQANALGLTLTRFVQVALPLGAAQLEPRRAALANGIEILESAEVSTSSLGTLGGATSEEASDSHAKTDEAAPLSISRRASRSAR